MPLIIVAGQPETLALLLVDDGQPVLQPVLAGVVLYCVVVVAGVLLVAGVLDDVLLQPLVQPRL